MRSAGSLPGIAGVLGAALLSWTCTREPIARTTPEPEPAPTADVAIAPAGGPDDPADEPVIPPERYPPPPQAIVEEGVLGLRLPIYDPSGEAMAHFHDALRRTEAGEGKTRVAVFGASHVAADLFVGHLREKLQSRFGDAGHGFILPARAWRYYRHRDVDVECNFRQWDGVRVRVTHAVPDYYGLLGAYVESNRRGATSAIVQARGARQPIRTSSYELWFLKQPGGGDVDVVIDGRTVGRVVTRGERIEAGYATFAVPDGPHRFEVSVRGNGKVRLYGVVMERDVPGVVVDTLGINGSRARNQLYWDEDLFREHLTRRDPDLVVLAYGTNEAGDDDWPIDVYEEELRIVMRRFHEMAPEASCLLIGPSDRPLMNEVEHVYEERPRTAQLIEVQRRVSVDFGCGFFDLVAFQGGPLSMVDWVAADPPYGQPDHIHYTRLGYERLGEVLHDALLSGYEPVEPGEPIREPGAPVLDSGSEHGSSSRRTEP